MEQLIQQLQATLTIYEIIPLPQFVQELAQLKQVLNKLVQYREIYQSVDEMVRYLAVDSEVKELIATYFRGGHLDLTKPLGRLSNYLLNEQDQVEMVKQVLELDQNAATNVVAQGYHTIFDLIWYPNLTPKQRHNIRMYMEEVVLIGKRESYWFHQSCHGGSHGQSGYPILNLPDEGNYQIIFMTEPAARVHNLNKFKSHLSGKNWLVGHNQWFSVGDRSKVRYTIQDEDYPTRMLTIYTADEDEASVLYLSLAYPKLLEAIKIIAPQHGYNIGTKVTRTDGTNIHNDVKYNPGTTMTVASLFNISLSEYSNNLTNLTVNQLVQHYSNRVQSIKVKNNDKYTGSDRKKYYDDAYFHWPNGFANNDDRLPPTVDNSKLLQHLSTLRDLYNLFYLVPNVAYDVNMITRLIDRINSNPTSIITNMKDIGVYGFTDLLYEDILTSVNCGLFPGTTNLQERLRIVANDFSFLDRKFNKSVDIISLILYNQLTQQQWQALQNYIATRLEITPEERTYWFNTYQNSELYKMIQPNQDGGIVEGEMFNQTGMTSFYFVGVYLGSPKSRDFGPVQQYNRLLTHLPKDKDYFYANRAKACTQFLSDLTKVGWKIVRAPRVMDIFMRFRVQYKDYPIRTFTMELVNPLDYAGAVIFRMNTALNNMLYSLAYTVFLSYDVDQQGYYILESSGNPIYDWKGDIFTPRELLNYLSLDYLDYRDPIVDNQSLRDRITNVIKVRRGHSYKDPNRSNIYNKIRTSGVDAAKKAFPTEEITGYRNDILTAVKSVGYIGVPQNRARSGNNSNTMTSSHKIKLLTPGMF